MTNLLQILAAAVPPAAETAVPATEAASRWIEYGVLGVSVAVIMAAAAVGTAMAQRAIGPAAIGAAAEDKTFRGLAILLIALPETILIICAGIAYMLMQKIL